MVRLRFNNLPFSAGKKLSDLHFYAGFDIIYRQRSK